jgi:hypothetical protein
MEGIWETLTLAPGVAPHELFSAPPSPKEAMEKLRQAILGNLDRAIENSVDKAVQKTLAGKCKD